MRGITRIELLDLLAKEQEKNKELLEACKGIIEWWHKYQDGFLPEEFEKVERAISKAEGK